MASAEFITRPLKGMGTKLGRFVLNLFRAGILAALVGFVLIVLDALLLPGPNSRRPD